MVAERYKKREGIDKAAKLLEEAGEEKEAKALYRKVVETFHPNPRPDYYNPDLADDDIIEIFEKFGETNKAVEYWQEKARYFATARRYVGTSEWYTPRSVQYYEAAKIYDHIAKLLEK